MIQVAFMLVVLLFIAWLVLPQLAMALGLSEVRGGIVRNTITQEQALLPAEVSEEISSIGAAFLGHYWEQAPLNPMILEHVYSCPTASGFVLAYRLGFDSSVQISILTGFESGSIVLTQNYNGGMTIKADGIISGPPHAHQSTPDRVTRLSTGAEISLMTAMSVLLLGISLLSTWYFSTFFAETFLVWLGPLASLVLVCWIRVKMLTRMIPRHEQTGEEMEILGPGSIHPLEQVLEEHQRRVTALQLAGDRPTPIKSMEDFIHSCQLYNQHPAVITENRLSSLTIAWNILLFLTSLGLAMTLWMGDVTHPAVWSVVLFACLMIWRLLRRHVDPAEKQILAQVRNAPDYS